MIARALILAQTQNWANMSAGLLNESWLVSRQFQARAEEPQVCLKCPLDGFSDRMLWSVASCGCSCRVGGWALWITPCKNSTLTVPWTIQRVLGSVWKPFFLEFLRSERWFEGKKRIWFRTWKELMSFPQHLLLGNITNFYSKRYWLIALPVFSW